MAMKLIIVFLTVCNLYTVFGLNCYECTSIINQPPDCQSGFEENPEYQVTCSATMVDPQCYLAYMTSEDGTIVRYERGCIDGDECENNCRDVQKGIYHLNQCTKCCTTGNFCNDENDGDRIKFHAALLVIVIASMINNIF